MAGGVVDNPAAGECNGSFNCWCDEYIEILFIETVFFCGGRRVYGANVCPASEEFRLMEVGQLSIIKAA